MTLVYLVASKEAVFVFLSVATQRLFAKYFFLNTTQRRSTVSPADIEACKNWFKDH